MKTERNYLAGAFFAGLAFLAFAVPAPGGAAQAQDNHPKLVVQISVDQFRGDHLQRLDPMFTGGLRRLLDEGFIFTEATAAHAITTSVPGHISLATGKYPRNHGIPQLEWLELNESGEFDIATMFDDAEHPLLDIPEMEGGGPERIRTTSIAEWFSESYPQGRFAAIGGSEYTAMLHAAHRRGHVYWFVPEARGFTTSDYYGQSLPGWVQDTNRQVYDSVRENPVWTLSAPEEFHNLARRDSAYYERDGQDIVFPHVFEGSVEARMTETENDEGVETDRLAEWIYNTVYLDDMTFAMAHRAIDELDLGQGERTDFLSIVAASVDHVGHYWGPRSLEQLDTFYRLDRHLGRLFAKLDREVGRDNYIVALSADHGVSNAVEWDLEQGRHALQMTPEVIRAFVNWAAEAAESYEGPEEGIRPYLIERLEEHPLVADAYDAYDVLSNPQQDAYRRLFHNSATPERIFLADNMSGSVSIEGHPLQYGVGFRFVEGVSIEDHEITGIHGAPYYRDRHVAMAFWGPGVSPGQSDVPVNTVDVAPTLACLAGVAPPDGLDGRILFGEGRCGR